MAVLSPSEIFNLDVDMAGMYRRAMDVQGRKSTTRVHDRGQTMREWAPKHIVVKLALKNPHVLRLFRPR
jgi:hypothetical protein